MLSYMYKSQGLESRHINQYIHLDEELLLDDELLLLLLEDKLEEWFV